LHFVALFLYGYLNIISNFHKNEILSSFLKL